MKKNSLHLSYFLQNNVVELAKDLLGKYIFTCIDNHFVGGIISETEAYNGIFDKGSHAYRGKRTKRNEMMYHQGGVIYVYLCYGVHAMLNIVSNKKDIPDAILIRSIIPITGQDIILQRMNKPKITKNLINGPGKVAKALGITLADNGTSLFSNKIWLENHNLTLAENDICISPRIGIDYAEEDALLPYRFFINPKSEHKYR